MTGCFSKEEKRLKFRYKSFINSEWWERQKLYWYSRHRKRCARCRSCSNIHLHHKKYPKNGRYLSLEDNAFVALCGKRHFIFHKKSGVYGNMQTASNKFIKQLGFIKYKRKISKRQQRLIDEAELKDFPVII